MSAIVKIYAGDFFRLIDTNQIVNFEIYAIDLWEELQITAT